MGLSLYFVDIFELYKHVILSRFFLFLMENMAPVHLCIFFKKSSGNLLFFFSQTLINLTYLLLIKIREHCLDSGKNSQ